MAGQLFGYIIIGIISLFVLYYVIYTAVKDGINNSLVGQSLDKQQGNRESKKSFLDNDLDS